MSYRKQHFGFIHEKLSGGSTKHNKKDRVFAMSGSMVWQKDYYTDRDYGRDCCKEDWKYWEDKYKHHKKHCCEQWEKEWEYQKGKYEEWKKDWKYKKKKCKDWLGDDCGCLDDWRGDY
ncbi:hypothetical protein LC087_00160 [Bacillus carboniphilus]|uniref:Uncharacterized protein n=1 Tax=Bacillus carboniphilus TaxID=86663 RepID=A0ABY9JWB2_9BACI|nr:hypothetical protein [Bacillus carboniphilus]WLR42705.1 hypothetical protein LC087_00160 [Bacillus carboniphilus]